MATDKRRYVYTKVRAWAVFPELSVDRVDLMRVSINYGVNSIPTATCQLSVGVDPRTGKAAASHKYAQQLERRMRIFIYAYLVGDEYAGKPWPKDPFIIFDGYITGIGTTRTHGALTLAVQAENWLTDMRSSSKFSAHLHVMSGGNLITKISTEAKSKVNVKRFNTDRVDLDDDFLNDIWGKGVGLLLKDLAEKDRIDIDALADMFKGQRELYANTAALAALSRISGTLKLRTEAASAELRDIIADWVNESLGELISDPSTGVTLWDTLLAAAQQLQFSLIPTTQSAIVAAFVRQVKQTYALITADEYLTGSSAGSGRTPLRAVGLMGIVVYPKTKDRSSYPEYEDAVKPADRFLGYFDIVELNKSLADSSSKDYRPDLVNGQFLVFRPPTWMAKISPSTDNVHKTLPIKGHIASVLDPDGSKQGNDDSGCRSRRMAEVAGSDIGDRFAQVMYLDRAFASRNGSITGRLRFDIAPGSSIAIEVVGGKLPFYQQGRLYASVNTVSCVLDTTNSTADTTFQITNIRTRKEQYDLQGLAVDQHPMYTDLWVGTSLVPGFSPANTE